MKSFQINDLDFSKLEGLIPVVVQSVENSNILMLAFADKEAVRMTLESGYAHYWSRSSKSLWKKGESSGNYQNIEAIWVDCDSDTLIYRVRQEGPACHTGAETCFFRELKKVIE